MALTDEQVLEAVITEGNQQRAGKKLGISGVAVMSRLKRMKLAGVNVPKVYASGPKPSLTPERVAELNEYIRKTQEAHAGRS